MNNSLINKYNIPVPRYTSYPPANYFGEITPQQYISEIERSNSYPNRNLSFYIHIPFCRHLCHYCGCNSMAMGNASTVTAYVEALHKEIDLLLPLIDANRCISQIHYGGGSPTALPVSAISELNHHLLSSFKTIEHPEIAIEVHPGYLDREQWQALTQCGFTRMSIGVQDFDEKVLQNVNRRPSLLPMQEITALLREAHIRFNMDFLYGLPGQTADSFAHTISTATALRPHRLVTFSYAHVPWVNKRQMILERKGLPAKDEKARMFEQAAQVLRQAGYQPIGMDHFVLPDDDLYTAFKNHQLHRNFQGYCTRNITAQVYALGVSGISQLDGMYAQNTKDIDTYLQKINQGVMPVCKGYILNSDEQITREIIETLMCNYSIQWTDIAQRLNITPEEVIAAIAYDEHQLNEMQADGLINFNKEGITMTTQGSPFVRNVAAALDKLMIGTTRQFSKPV